jgi:uncharacterized protein with HEPN domain
LTSRDPRELLQDILTSAQLARDYVAGLELEAFEAIVEKQDAVIHRLELIGEAAGKLPAEVTAAMPTVPWAQIKGMRNLMVHQYWEISLKRVWAVVQNDLPPLIAAIEAHRS